MKKLITITLCMILLACAAFTGCKKEEYVPEGPTEVNYGEVSYKSYNDGTALTFDYLDCFAPAVEADEESASFVANTPDDKGVLSYEFFDSFKDYERTNEYYKVPSRKYAEIAAYSEEEALDYMKIIMGMVSAQGAEYTVESHKFEVHENFVYLSLEATATYERTGEIQKLWLEKYVVENERVYTVQAFVPASCLTKYGPVFKNVVFDIENALTNGVPAGQ